MHLINKVVGRITEIVYIKQLMIPLVVEKIQIPLGKTTTITLLPKYTTSYHIQLNFQGKTMNPYGKHSAFYSSVAHFEANRYMIR